MPLRRRSFVNREEPHPLTHAAPRCSGVGAIAANTVEQFGSELQILIAGQCRRLKPNQLSVRPISNVVLQPRQSSDGRNAATVSVFRPSLAAILLRVIGMGSSELQCVRP